MIQGLGFKILKGIFLKGQELNLIKQNQKNQTTTTASRPNYTLKLNQGCKGNKKSGGNLEVSSTVI